MKLFESCYAIGSQVKENIPPDELASLNEFLPGVAVSLVESLLFSKIMFKNQVFYSERCSNVKKRNSYTVSFLRHGVLSYGCIAYFLKLTTHHHGIQIYHLAAINELHHRPGEGIMCDERLLLANNLHLKPFRLVRLVLLYVVYCF